MAKKKKKNEFVVVDVATKKKVPIELARASFMFFTAARRMQILCEEFCIDGVGMYLPGTGSVVEFMKSTLDKEGKNA
jgi:hypothetical protein